MTLISTIIVGMIFVAMTNVNHVIAAQTNSKITSKNMTTTKSENITAPIAPQGTSINISNAT